jgi:hypothetical protein
LAHNVEAQQWGRARHCYLATAMHNLPAHFLERSSQRTIMNKLSVAAAAAVKWWPIVKAANIKAQ